jgi:hypothetical protein
VFVVCCVRVQVWGFVVAACAFVVFFFGAAFFMAVFLALAAGDFPLALLGLLLFLLAVVQRLLNFQGGGQRPPCQQGAQRNDMHPIAPQTAAQTRKPHHLLSCAWLLLPSSPLQVQASRDFFK